MGFVVEERKISIDELLDAHNQGTLNEVFGTGTAATISLIKELKYQEHIIKFDVDNWQTAPKVKPGSTI